MAQLAVKGHTYTRAIGEIYNIRQCEKAKEEVTTISASRDGLYEAQGVLLKFQSS